MEEGNEEEGNQNEGEKDEGNEEEGKEGEEEDLAAEVVLPGDVPEYGVGLGDRATLEPTFAV